MTKDKKKVSKKRVIIHSIILILLVVGISFLFIPLFNNLKFGLDLQGGFEILYKAESIDGSKMTTSKLTSTYKTLSKRIDSLGVSEPEIIIEGNDKVHYLYHFSSVDPIVRAYQLSFIEIKSAIGARSNLGRPTTTAKDNKDSFMCSLGL